MSTREVKVLKVVKKSVEVEAVLWDKSGISQKVMSEFVPSSCRRLDYSNCGTFDCPELYIVTLEGDMHVSDGDYVIKGIKGEFYPCKPDVFELTYTVAPNNSYLDRMVVELNELKEKQSGLQVFIQNSPVYKELPTQEQDLLNKQHFHMLGYIHTLSERIELTISKQQRKDKPSA